MAKKSKFKGQPLLIRDALRVARAGQAAGPTEISPYRKPWAGWVVWQTAHDNEGVGLTDLILALIDAGVVYNER